MTEETKKVISDDLLEILVCPSCHSEVHLVDEDSALLCKGCGLKYPIRDGIPVMLIDEAEQTKSKAEDE